MITLTVSFKRDEANVGMVAQVVQLLAKLETQSPAMDPVVAAQSTIKEEPVKAPRAKRVYTEAEKQAIRERLAAGRAEAEIRPPGERRYRLLSSWSSSPAYRTPDNRARR